MHAASGLEITAECAHPALGADIGAHCGVDLVQGERSNGVVDALLEGEVAAAIKLRGKLRGQASVLRTRLAPQAQKAGTQGIQFSLREAILQRALGLVEQLLLALEADEARDPHLTQHLQSPAAWRC